MDNTTLVGGRGLGVGGRQGRRDLRTSSKEEDRRCGPGFCSFAFKESALYRRVSLMERKLNRWTETVKSIDRTENFKETSRSDVTGMSTEALHFSGVCLLNFTFKPEYTIWKRRKSS